MWKYFYFLHYDIYGFPSGSVGKESACNAGDVGSIPRLGRSPGEGNGNPCLVFLCICQHSLLATQLQYSCQENPMSRGARHATWDRKESDTTVRLTFRFMIFITQEFIILFNLSISSSNLQHHAFHLMYSTIFKNIMSLYQTNIFV